MPDLLIGRDDIAAFTNAAYTGFGDGGGAVTKYTAAAAGTATELNVSINSFGANSLVAVALYEQVAGSGDFDLIETVNVSSGAAPQQVTGLSFAITATNVYRVGFFGDNTTLDANAGNGFQIDSDPLIGTPDGLGSIVSEYPTLPATLNTVGREADGEFYWNFGGTLAGPGENLGARITVETEAGAAIPNANYLVWVEDSTGTTLVAQQTIASISGTITVDSQLLGSLTDVVYMAIRLSAEADADMAAVMVPATVFDLDA